MFRKFVNLMNSRCLPPFATTGTLLGGLVLIFCFVGLGCGQTNVDIMDNAPTAQLKQNRLDQSNNPYLLQHANNPVHWQPWDTTVLQAARETDKLLIISIGYSSCHWCHVMEHESFEDTGVAAVMNEQFVPIKVDREERPDVDDVYMTAVQLMTQRGGWPLNVVALPDGRPVWGATYVPREQWLQVLKQLSALYQEDPRKMEEYAQKLQRGIQQVSLVETGQDTVLPPVDLDALVAGWQKSWDVHFGGREGAPKFPLPGAQQFLLRLGFQLGHKGATEQAHLTLENLAQGGIYDQVGGGFARYSTDSLWKVPHFEKMLYDNAQLLKLFSLAHQHQPSPNYQRTVEQTIQFLDREMTGPQGGYYAALDADSPGGEGRFYTWTKEELQQLIPAAEWPLFADYYQVNERGYWEDEQYILWRGQADEAFAEAHGLSREELYSLVDQWRQQLLAAREERSRPATDDKQLTSWNALMIQGLVAAYRTFGRQAYLAKAEDCARWLREQQMRKNDRLWHTYRKGKASVEGLLEDYAQASAAWLDLYEVTSREAYLEQADQWVRRAQEHFRAENGFYDTRPKEDNTLIARSQETSDNVIPSANAVMARNLYRLGHYRGVKNYREEAESMLAALVPQLRQSPEGYYAWGELLLNFQAPHYEIAITGPEASEKLLALGSYYLPHCLIAASNQASEYPLHQGRFDAERTRLYVCQLGACKLPVREPAAAVEQLTSRWKKAHE